MVEHGVEPPSPSAGDRCLQSAFDHSRVPGDEVITRLRNLVREAEARWGARSVAVSADSARLQDQTFPQMMPTPFGAVPVFGVELPPLGSPLPIPKPLAGVWGVDTEVTRLTALDVETAATVGGSRDIPFVIGLAYSDGKSLRLEQIVLRGMEDEEAALWALEHHMAHSSHLVTYNGSRFDLPLLNRRAMILRHGEFVAPRGAIDLEPIARETFGRQGLSTRLTEVEDRVMAMTRPSWTWHPIWRECDGLAWRRRRHLARILAKNGADTLSLLLLFRMLVDLVDRPGENAKLALFIGSRIETTDPQEARRWYRHAAEGTLNDDRLRAALAAWRLEGPSDRMAAVLVEGVRARLPSAWHAAERLGLGALRAGDRNASLRWCEEALRHNPPTRIEAVLRARLQRLRKTRTA